PIPNREVKPASADDTAIPGGKVGRRQDYKTPFRKKRGFFIYNLKVIASTNRYCHTRRKILQAGS
ncbi:MAG: hypothetical protein C0591_04680, partial [Marinilabiliales bacterium]